MAFDKIRQGVKNVVIKTALKHLPDSTIAKVIGDLYPYKDTATYRRVPAEPLDLVAHLANFIENCQALFEDAAPSQLQTLLRQITDAHAAGLLHLAVVEGFQPGQHLHQRGFAGAVGSNKRGLLPCLDQPIGLQKQFPRSKPLAGILQGEHLLPFSQSDVRGPMRWLASQGRSAPPNAHFAAIASIMERFQGYCHGCR